MKVKTLLLIGIINMAIFALFLYGPWEGWSGPRPEFSMRLTLEWGVYWAIVGYLLALTLSVWRKERRIEGSQ